MYLESDLSRTSDGYRVSGSLWIFSLFMLSLSRLKCSPLVLSDIESIEQMLKGSNFTQSVRRMIFLYTSDTSYRQCNFIWTPSSNRRRILRPFRFLVLHALDAGFLLFSDAAIYVRKHLETESKFDQTTVFKTFVSQSSNTFDAGFEIFSKLGSKSNGSQY